MASQLCLTAALVAVLMPASLVARQEPTVQAICSQHPPSDRAAVNRARSAGMGLREQRIFDLGERAKKEGLEVPDLGSDPGGGDCAAEPTPHGSAAAAVGALLYNGQPHCSAVLISPTMAISAAHCVKGFDINKMEFALGQDAERPVQRSTVYSADVHPGYDQGHLGVNDLAYVYLNFRMTEAEPVTLATARLPPSTTRSLLHVGYGIAGPRPGVRRCVEIPLHDACETSFSHATKNLNTCNGDSGGGVFLSSGRDVSWVGVTAWGDEQCAEFGVSMDVGANRDWVKARMFDAPWPLRPARVEPSARSRLNASADEIFKQLRQRGASAVKFFDDVYRGKWVNWTASVVSVEPRDSDAFPGACNIVARAGASELMLRHYPDGCDVAADTRLEFTGRLAQLRPLATLELALLEPTQSRGPASALTDSEPLGQFTLVRVGNEARTIRERRSRDVRLESRRAKWSGRVTECIQVPVDPPWKLDTEAPIRFAPAHVNSAGVAGDAQDKSDHGFCLPLWAEGFGGAQLLGVTVDAGGIGVISGTVEFGVLRDEALAAPSEVLRSVIRSDKPVEVAFAQGGTYELHVKLRDGSEHTVTESTVIGDVRVAWNTQGVQLNPIKRQ